MGHYLMPLPSWEEPRHLKLLKCCLDEEGKSAMSKLWIQIHFGRSSLLK